MITDFPISYKTEESPQNCTKTCPHSSLSWRTYNRFTEWSPSSLNLSHLFPQVLPNLCHHFLLYKYHINIQSSLKFSNHFIKLQQSKSFTSNNFPIIPFSTFLPCTRNSISYSALSLPTLHFVRNITNQLNLTRS